MMYMSTSTRSASRLTPAHEVLASAPASLLTKGRPEHAAALGPPPPLGPAPVPESPPDPEPVPPLELVVAPLELVDPPLETVDPPPAPALDVAPAPAVP